MKIFRSLAIAAVAALAAFFLAGCLFKPAVYAGYAIINNPDCRSTLVIGSNNTQANAVHSPLGDITDGGEAGAEADAQAGKAKSGGLFVNNTVGNRSADIDATSTLEKLSRVKESTVGQNTGRDQSPISAETTPTTNKEKRVSVSVPLSASQNGNATATSSAETDVAEDDGGER